MADILSSDDIASIQSDVAPATDDELFSTIEVWRKPRNADGVVPGGSGVDEYGEPADNDDAVPSSVRELVGSYPGRIVRAGVGAEVDWGSQAVNILKFTVSISWALNPNIEGGDYLLADNRRFEVIDPGGDTTYKVMRMVRVEEVLS